jgi:hypothetical protein
VGGGTVQPVVTQRAGARAREKVVDAWAPRLATPMPTHLKPRTMFYLARLAYLLVPLMVALPALLIATLSQAA